MGVKACCRGEACFLAPFPEGPAGPEERENRTSSLFSKQVVLCELKVSTRWAEMMKEVSA